MLDNRSMSLNFGINVTEVFYNGIQGIINLIMLCLYNKTAFISIAVVLKLILAFLPLLMSSIKALGILFKSLVLRGQLPFQMIGYFLPAIFLSKSNNRYQEAIVFD